MNYSQTLLIPEICIHDLQWKYIKSLCEVYVSEVYQKFKPQEHFTFDFAAEEEMKESLIHDDGTFVMITHERVPLRLH